MNTLDWITTYLGAMAHLNSNITLKLLIDGCSQKVLFGEAGKDFVDFLFSLLTLPLGSVIKLLTPSIMTGSIGKLYESVENLNQIYLISNREKSTLLQPQVSTFDVASPLLLDAEVITQQKYYLCYYCKKKMTIQRNFMCPNCKLEMTIEVDIVVPSVSDSTYSGAGGGGERVGGFVKGVITYMITDDLEVTPMSAISSIALINRFSMKMDVQLKEMVINVGMKEGLALLKASLDSRTVLTDVFCKKAKVSPSSTKDK